MKATNIVIRALEGAGNLKAFVDLRMGDIEIRGSTIMEGKQGLFFNMPRRIGRDGRWTDVVTFVDTDKARKTLERLKADVMKAYELSLSNAEDKRRHVTTDDCRSNGCKLCRP